MQESSYITDFEAWLAKVKDLPFFASLDPERARNLLAHCRVRRYEPGEAIIQEGESDGLIYILASGQARVEKNGLPLISLNRLGDIFGEMSRVEGLPRSATVRAMTKVLCMAVDVSMAESLTGREKVIFHSMFYRTLAEKLAEKLRRANVEMVTTRNLVENLRRTLELKNRAIDKYRRAGLV
jgi:CRP-like cAMP-binding protein